MSNFREEHAGFFAIEDELARRKEHYESTKGKTLPFRVEFRFKGSKAWQYYVTYEDALKADDYVKCKYNIFGSAVTEYPSSRQIQAKGVRGGWSKYKG